MADIPRPTTPESLAKQNINDVASERLGETWTVEDETKVVRKIDWHLMPPMTVAYMLQFLDKITLNNASIMGIKQDLHLTGSEYSWASSIFYFGYLVAAYPASIGLAKLPLGKFGRTDASLLSSITWGVLLALHAVPHNFAGLMVLRFFLGVFESVISPAFSLIVSIWYRQEEHASRHSIWSAGNVGGSIVGSFVSFGIAHITGFPAWKALFILYGGLGFLWGLVLLFLRPDGPSKARFLTPEQRELAVNRVSSFRLDRARKYDIAEIKEALCDVQTWIIASWALLTCFGNSALTAMPIYVIIALLVTGMVGAIMVRQVEAPQKGARFFGMLLFSKFTCAFPLVLSLNASNIGGQTKKTFASAMFFIAYCVGNIAGPQVFIASEAPSYPTAFATMIVTVGGAAIVMATLRVVLTRRNRKRDDEFGPPSEDITEESEDAQRTDWQSKKTFRYRY
ncbi:hypothetical protein UA08_08535 [Talaromyces atroroseus]|uniref:Major facilitator superfamily (MFS) profile domain-containing protein n=1 Tax=Talaromyces atroroseus TaxID=1441469 RepID=A0A1Q5Q803_TALAT|nr:hypothetical protein UA08_08535 [Talaromyces atroroseus]OKL56349.1 hypothetical protein UA08_08535 [Talaromyces atroroseus]